MGTGLFQGILIFRSVWHQFVHGLDWSAFHGRKLSLQANVMNFGMFCTVIVRNEHGNVSAISKLGHSVAFLSVPYTSMTKVKIDESRSSKNRKKPHVQSRIFEFSFRIAFAQQPLLYWLQLVHIVEINVVSVDKPM